MKWVASVLVAVLAFALIVGVLYAVSVGGLLPHLLLALFTLAIIGFICMIVALIKEFLFG